MAPHVLLCCDMIHYKPCLSDMSSMTRPASLNAVEPTDMAINIHLNSYKHIKIMITWICKQTISCPDTDLKKMA